jgi:diguanylate cyclase (GGDEF)-like protein/PAS domain S-box-containing protein
MNPKPASPVPPHVLADGVGPSESSPISPCSADSPAPPRSALDDQELARLRLLELAVEKATDAVVITTGDLDPPGPFIVYVNEAFTRISGYTREEAIGATPRLLQGSGTSRDVMGRMKSTLAAGRPFVGEATNYRKDGTPYYMEWSVHALHAEPDGTTGAGPADAASDPLGAQSDPSQPARALYYVAVQRDITERKRHEMKIEEQTRALAIANERLAALSLTDSLTGLGNHRAFHQRLDEEWARARRHCTPLSLILLDIDHFKGYNDSFGHPAGDEALQIAASLLQRHSRASDVVARHGGEEFALLLPQTNSEGAIALAETLRNSFLQAPWPHRAVTISLGVSTWTPDPQLGSGAPGAQEASARTLVRAADAAMYRSKAGGRNRTTAQEISGACAQAALT